VQVENQNTAYNLSNGLNNDLMVLHFDPNGILDTSFGMDGVTIYDGGGGNDGGTESTRIPGGISSSLAFGRNLT